MRKFCIWCGATTCGFPLEHLAWERLPVLCTITHALGL